MVRSLGITLDQGIEQPLYLQIVDAIASRIKSGAMPEGFRLPPTRALAGELGTHRNTVVRAYDELSATGLTQSVVGRGTFVAPQSDPPTARAVGGYPAHPWAQLTSRAANSEPLRRVDRIARSVRSGDAINLTRMQPPPELLPHEELRRCVNHVLRTRGAKALGYAPREGVPALRELIARELNRAGVPASAQAVTITTGSQQALDILARALINPGDAFLVDESTYTGAINILTAAGARLIGIPSDDEGPRIAALEQANHLQAKGFYLMPNCGNPTGRSITAARRRELVDWSHRAGVPLIEDDYGADLNLTGTAPPPALRALDGEVIYVGTFSKKLIPALRVGFMVAPEAFRKQLLPLKHAMDLGTSGLLQYALAEFIDRGYLKAHLRRIQPVYRAKRDALVAALQGLPTEIEWTVPDNGVVIWLALPGWLDPEEVFGEAQRHGVLVTPGTLNAASSASVGGLRLTFCAESEERLAEGGRRLNQAIRVVMARRKTNESTPSLDGV